MARYKVRINTETYKCRACSKKNWEPGTMNDYMLAINGWHTTERSIKEVIWRLKMFAGYGWGADAWDYEKHEMKPEYQKWQNKRCNMVKYQDRLCGFERTQPVTVYGFAQGYVDINKVVEELRADGYVQIPFKQFYDVRQYYKGMDGCYLEIEKCK